MHVLASQAVRVWRKKLGTACAIGAGYRFANMDAIAGNTYPEVCSAYGASEGASRFCTANAVFNRRDLVRARSQSPSGDRRRFFRRSAVGDSPDARAAPG